MKCVCMVLVEHPDHLVAITFGKTAVETLKDNFYVDDLLKSLDNERETIKLIKNVKAMCASGGFKLNKFLSNKKQVLHSIDAADRRRGVKDKDLMGDLPPEQTLGVLRDTETDRFGFRVTLKQKIVNKEGSTISYQLSLRSFGVCNSFSSSRKATNSTAV